MTADVVLDAVNSLVAGFGFTRAIEPFSFDLQPAQNVGSAQPLYRVEWALERCEGYLGWAQAECWAFQLWLAVPHQRAPHGAQRTLTTAIGSLTAAISRAGVVQDWHLEDDDLEAEIRGGDGEAVFVVGRLAGTIDFDRAL